MTTPEPVDPTRDTGDVAAVPDSEQTDVDAPEPNDDADDDLADVVDGEIVDLEDGG